MEALINTKTSSLCFNKDEFVVKDFSVDNFVSNCRKYASLETMLEDLGLYHKILCCAMIELINKDYADFVNLSSNLVGLDKSIKNLSLPLEKLKKEVQDLKNNLDQTLYTAKSEFSEYSDAHKRKVLAHHAVCVLDGLKKIEDNSLMTEENIPFDVLERVALDYNLVVFHFNKISFKQLDDKKVVLEKIAESLKEHLEYLFLQSLSTNDVHCLCKVLRIYSVINQEREVEQYFRKIVVKPYIQKHLTEENVLKLGLAKVYDIVLDFIPKFCSAILNATRASKRCTGVVCVPGYDFLVNAVWPEIVQGLELIASVHVYAPGDPQLFYMNYTASILFLDRFEHYCEVQTSVQRLRKSKHYSKFVGKWNLDLYFQIRFQEIASKFENSLLKSTFVNSKDPGKENDNKYLLSMSSSVWECIKLCWEEKIFLQPLSYVFFRLTLQLISRFNNAAHASLKWDKNQEQLSPEQLAMLIKDVEQLITDLKLFFEHKIVLKISRVHAEISFQESIKLLEEFLPLAGSLMIKSLTEQCCSHLKLITDIPRLYRKTNRDIPSKPSAYVSLVFNSLMQFLSATDSILSAKSKQTCIAKVTDGVIIQCTIMIRDVLTSIKKIEDSLKILKRARDKPLGQVSVGTITDDDKIRRQLVIDVNSMEEIIKELGLQIDNIESFKELKLLVNSAEKPILQN